MSTREQRTDPPRAEQTLRELGRSAPTDVAVVRFVNWDIVVRPPLAGVDMNLDAPGRATGERVLKMMSGRAVAVVRRLSCALVARESCGMRAGTLRELQA